MSESTCPQCTVFSEAINQLVSDSGKERKADLLKRSLDEVKLLNIKSYAHLIGASLDRSGGGSSYNLPSDWHIVSGECWNDMQVMLYHIDETLAALLPQEVTI